MIIGVTGTNGAGKGTVVDYLVSKKGFKHYSAREFIVEEVKRRGLPVNRDTITYTANDLRATYGPAYVVEELIKRTKADGGNVVIESIRTISEAEVLRKEGGFIFAVDADPHTRYERAVRRGSETDKVDFETFIAQEERELTSNDPNKQNVLGVVAMADYQLLNNGTLEELQYGIANIFAQKRFD